MKIRLKWTHVLFRAVLITLAITLLIIAQGTVVRFVYQVY